MNPYDTLALVQLMEEATGASKMMCLEVLVRLTNQELPDPPPRPEPTTNGASRPFDSHKFRAHLRTLKVGTKLTAREVAGRLHMTIPQHSKIGAYAMRDEGWVPDSGFKDGGQQVYCKPMDADG